MEEFEQMKLKLQNAEKDCELYLDAKTKAETAYNQMKREKAALEKELEEQAKTQVNTVPESIATDVKTAGEEQTVLTDLGEQLEELKAQTAEQEQFFNSQLEAKEKELQEQVAAVEAMKTKNETYVAELLSQVEAAEVREQ